MNPPETLKQQTEKVPVNTGGDLIVRRMLHKPARAFFKKLAAVIHAKAGLLKRGDDGQISLFKFEQLAEQLPDLIASADDLADFLVIHSTDDQDTVDKLDFVSWANALAAALRLNCGDELKNCFAGIAAALAPLLADAKLKTKSGGAHTPSSSTPDMTRAI